MNMAVLEFERFKGEGDCFFTCIDYFFQVSALYLEGT